MEWIDAHLFDESHAVHGDGRMLCSSSITTSSDLHDPRTAGGNPCNLGQPLGLVLVKGLIYNMYFICASGTCAAQVASP